MRFEIRPLPASPIKDGTGGIEIGLRLAGFGSLDSDGIRAENAE
jgi:hypothetical protein